MDTTSLGFQKPKEEEYYDINIFNKNTQLTNDLIEKNSSEIGQKLDKNSSFYADLEAYYGNTKLIDDFQDISKWTQWAGIQSSDTTNVKIGNQSLKISENDNVAGQVYSVRFNTSVDLSSLNNGELSTDNDYVCLVCYISDITKIDTSQGVQLLLSQATDATTANCKNMEFKDGLVTGWNFLKAKKSVFTTNGTGKWSGIQSIRIRWYSTANAQNAYVSFQLIQLVKADPDTLLDKPNPFQKFGIKEFDINNGEWFVGYEFEELCITELSGSAGILGALVATNAFKDFIVNFTIKTNSLIKRYVGALYINSETGTTDYFYVQLISQGSSSEVQLVKAVNGVLKTIPKPFNYNVNDDVYVSVERKDNKLLAKIKTSTREEILTTEFNVASKMSMALGMDLGGRSQKYSSASITEISHTHHSDIAENLSENGKVDLLKKPKLISLSNNKIMQLGSFNYSSYFSLYAKIMRPNLHNGSQLSYADLYIGKYSSSYPVEGKLQKSIDLTQGQYNLRFVVTDKGKVYATSPLYNYSDWLLVENKNFTEDIREVAAIDGNIVWDSDNNTTKIALQQTPTETLITSGFASGWSGSLRYSKTQEGVANVNIFVSYSSDILSSPTLLYTLPVGMRCVEHEMEYIQLLDVGGRIVVNSECLAYTNLNGQIYLVPKVGATLSGTRIVRVSFSYIVRN